MKTYNASKSIFLSKRNIGVIKGDPEEFVFWCGAGLSALEPSNLPLGKELVDFVLAELVDESFAREISAILNSVDTFFSELGIEIGNCLRLESVISELSLLEKNMKPNHRNDLKFLDSLVAFQEAPYNINHLLLAILVSHGSCVVTTNYDLGIKKALDEMCPNMFRFEKYKEGQYVYKSDNERMGMIFHIHGIAPVPNELGITYQTASRLFHPKLRSYLDFWIENKRKFVFLGYSCGDNYDVERYFNGIGQSYNLVKAEAIYVQRRLKDHGGAVNRYLRCFSKSYVVTMGIEDFLKCVLKDTLNIKFDINDTVAFNWKEKIADLIGISDELKGILFFRICKLTGINPAKFTYYKTAKGVFDRLLNVGCYPVEEYIVRLTKEYILKENGNVEECKKLLESGSLDYNQKYNNTFFYANRYTYDMNSILELESNFTELYKNLPSIDKIKKGLHEYINKGKRIGWEFSTPLHQHMMIILDEAKEYNVEHERYELPYELVKRIKLLLLCNDEILSLDFVDLEELNQHCVALSIKSLLLAILFGESRKEEIDACMSKCIDLYANESSFQGVIMSMFRYSCILFLLYIQTSKYDYFFFSQKTLENVKRMLSIVETGKLKNLIKKEENWRIQYELFREAD